MTVLTLVEFQEHIDSSISLELSFPGYPHLQQNAIDSHRWTWWRRPTETWKDFAQKTPVHPFPEDNEYLKQ